MALLCQYSWPGNLREMQNVIESAVIMAASSVIEPDHLPFQTQDQSLFFELRERQGFMQSKQRALDNFEKQALSDFLLQTQGNISKAAELAQIPRRTFHRLIDEHSLKGRSFKSSS
ncbi:MAG: helix-turn-helix domain-containing protein [Blastocatellia bacterium]